MGALPLSKTLSFNLSIKTGILIAPAAEIGSYTKQTQEEIAKRLAVMAEGKLNGATYLSLLSDLKEVVKTTNPIDLAPKIARADEVTPPEMGRRLFEVAGGLKKWLQIEEADHGFSEHRIPLIKAILERINETL